MGNVPIKTAGGGFANFTDIAPMAVVNIEMTTKIKDRNMPIQKLHKCLKTEGFMYRRQGEFFSVLKAVSRRKKMSKRQKEN